MTSDDVSVNWKSAFSFTMSRSGGGGHTGNRANRGRKGDVETRGGKRLPVVSDVKRTTSDTKNTQNTP